MNNLFDDNTYDWIFETEASWYIYRNKSACQLFDVWPFDI